MTFKSGNFDYQFSEDDVVNADSFIPAGDFNPHNVRPFILHDAGFVVAVCFADCLQDAIDEAVDAGKLDRFQVTEEELKEYETGERTEVGSEHCPEGYPEYDGRIAHLGNASEPFDIESLDAVEVSNKSWTRDFWTHEQLVSQFESAGDSLGLTVQPIGSCGMTEKAIDATLANVRACLLELAARKAVAA